MIIYTYTTGKLNQVRASSILIFFKERERKKERERDRDSLSERETERERIRQTDRQTY